MGTTSLEIHGMQCRDLDQLSEQVASLGYDLDRTQLGPGQAACSMRLARAPHLVCVVESTGVPFLNRAAMSPEHVTFGVIMKSGAPVRYASMTQGANEIRVGPPGCSTDIVTQSPQIGAHLLFDLDWLDGFCAAAAFPRPAVWMPGGPEVLRSPHVARGLRRLVSATFHKSVRPPEDARAWTRAFATLLVGGLYRDPAGLLRRTPRTVSSRLHVHRALRFVDAHLGDSIRLQDLCRVAGVGLRTLQRAFLEELGLTPLAFVEVRRLVAARRLLMDPTRDTGTVAAAGRACGLKHAGRFSAAYREMFGEYPSETAPRQ